VFQILASSAVLLRIWARSNP